MYIAAAAAYIPLVPHKTLRHPSISVHLPRASIYVRRYRLLPATLNSWSVNQEHEPRRKKSLADRFTYDDGNLCHGLSSPPERERERADLYDLPLRSAVKHSLLRARLLLSAISLSLHFQAGKIDDDTK